MSDSKHQPTYSEPEATGTYNSRSRLPLYKVDITCSCGETMSARSVEATVQRGAEQKFAYHVERHRAKCIHGRTIAQGCRECNKTAKVLFGGMKW